MDANDSAVHSTPARMEVRAPLLGPATKDGGTLLGVGLMLKPPNLLENC